MLRQQFGLTVYAHSWCERNHVVGRIYLDHALFVADVLVTIELACRQRSDVRLLYEDELPIYAERQPFRWQVMVERRMKIGVVPDRLFAIEYTRRDQRERAYFFLEADAHKNPRRYSVSV